MEKFKKGYKLHNISGTVSCVDKHASRGKPKKGAEKVLVGYKVEAFFERDNVEIERILNRKGRFILATNNLDTESYKNEQILEEYKEQQNVEGGFRFLKDPWFMVDSIFLKLPKRIEALMMIMTLTLLVYNVGQYRLRQQLKMQKTTVPNQLGKRVQIYNESLSRVIKEVVTNINAIRKKIIYLFGETAVKIYGLIPKTQMEGLRM